MKIVKDKMVTAVNDVYSSAVMQSYRIINVDRQCWENAQYSRLACLENIWVPPSVSTNNLKGNIFNVFLKIGVDAKVNATEVFHRS